MRSDVPMAAEPPPMGRWWSFLPMAPAELQRPALGAGLGAVAAFVLALLAALPAGAALGTAACGLLAGAFWAWLAANRRLLTLENIPHSKIASAAQGYARLQGRAAPFPGQSLRSPLSGIECCWYRYSIVDQDRERSVSRSEHGESEWSFAIEDESGSCIVDPAGASLIPVRARRWTDDQLHFTEHLVLPGDPLCVIGQFSSSRSGASERDLEERAADLLARWKQDMPALHRRFGLAPDADFTVAQWEQVRAEARREAQAGAGAQPAQNLVSRPADGRAYLISAEDRPQLVRDLKLWAWFHLALVAGAAAFLAKLVFGRPPLP